jgi:hypothetical protein
MTQRSSQPRRDDVTNNNDVAWSQLATPFFCDADERRQFTIKLDKPGAAYVLRVASTARPTASLGFSVVGRLTFIGDDDDGGTSTNSVSTRTAPATPTPSALASSSSSSRSRRAFYGGDAVASWPLHVQRRWRSKQNAAHDGRCAAIVVEGRGRGAVIVGAAAGNDVSDDDDSDDDDGDDSAAGVIAPGLLSLEGNDIMAMFSGDSGDESDAADDGKGGGSDVDDDAAAAAAADVLGDDNDYDDDDDNDDDDDDDDGNDNGEADFDASDDVSGGRGAFVHTIRAPPGAAKATATLRLRVCSVSSASVYLFGHTHVSPFRRFYS